MLDAFVLTIYSFDLHVLSTPPAFVLSQDQTLMFYLDRHQTFLTRTRKIKIFLTAKSSVSLPNPLPCRWFSIYASPNKVLHFAKLKIDLIYFFVCLKCINNNQPLLEKLSVNQLSWLKFELISHIHLCIFPLAR